MDLPTEVLAIETPTHGRVLRRERPGAPVVVVGFHGYMEDAEVQMERLRSLPGSDAWTLVSVQGLHRFYRGRSQEVVASWMTRQDRELMIRDNIEYAARALDAVTPEGATVVTAGFSQGVALAFRCAVRRPLSASPGLRQARRVSGVIAVGGDVPPELLEDAAVEFPAALLARGEHDEWYTAAKLEADTAALRARHARVETLVYSAAHEWTTDVAVAAARFIASLAGT